MSEIGVEAYPIMIEEVAEGAARRLFDSAVKQLLGDLEDEMKKTEATRSFNIKFTFQANDETAQNGKWTVELVGQKMAPSRAFSEQLVVRGSRGKSELLAYRQESIDDLPGITDISTRGRE